MSASPEWEVAAAARVAKAAGPTAPLVPRAVLTSPEARPACSAAMPVVARARVRHQARRQRGGPGALYQARCDQHRRIAGETAGEAGEAERRDAREEDPPVTDEVGGAGRQQQQSAERDQVAVDDPLQRRRSHSQVEAHLRQGHVHDQPVQDHHQLRPAGEREYRDRRVLPASLPVRSTSTFGINVTRVVRWPTLATPRSICPTSTPPQPLWIR
nr:hypothetical protein [Rhodococcus sp. D2-41]